MCGGELAGCVVEVWNSTTAPVFSGCMSTKPGPVLVARAYAPSQVAVWRSARLDLARGFDSAAIVRDMERLAAVLGGYSEHVRVQNILASNDDSLGDPALLVVPGPGLSPAYQLSAVSVVFQMPAPMLYNLETLLLVPTSVAAQQLKAEFGIVGIERTDWIAPVPPADSASTTATSRWALATGVFVGLMLARNQ